MQSTCSVSVAAGVGFKTMPAGCGASVLSVAAASSLNVQVRSVAASTVVGVGCRTTCGTGSPLS